jgi:hypothetical protein
LNTQKGAYKVQTIIPLVAKKEVRYPSRSEDPIESEIFGKKRESAVSDNNHAEGVAWYMLEFEHSQTKLEQ